MTFAYEKKTHNLCCIFIFLVGPFFPLITKLKCMLNVISDVHVVTCECRA